MSVVPVVALLRLLLDSWTLVPGECSGVEKVHITCCLAFQFSCIRLGGPGTTGSVIQIVRFLVKYQVENTLALTALLPPQAV